MPFQPIVSQRLYQQVANQIGELIRTGQFAAGHRLPPERDLAKSLGASRPVVREAMIALELAGLVEVRGGSGAYVKAPSEWVANGNGGSLLHVLTDSGPGPFDVISARVMIEGEIVFAAASEATPEDLRGIAETITMMQSAVRVGRTERADRPAVPHPHRRRHPQRRAAADRRVSLGRDNSRPVFTALSTRTHLPQNRAATLRDHTRIADALMAHDAVEARDAMRAHLGDVMRVLMRDDDVDAGTGP